MGRLPACVKTSQNATRCIGMNTHDFAGSLIGPATTASEKNVRLRSGGNRRRVPLDPYDPLLNELLGVRCAEIGWRGTVRLADILHCWSL